MYNLRKQTVGCKMIQSSIKVGKKYSENRVVLQPMEGCDCNTDGSPSELTVEKYIRAAKSGAAGILKRFLQCLISRSMQRRSCRSTSS